MNLLLQTMATTLHSIALIVAISLFTVPGVAAQGYSGSTNENYYKTYSFFGGSDCYNTHYISSGETFRINAWESSYRPSYGSSCNLYFQTSDSSAKDPVFKFKFDSNKRNYIDESSVSLGIYDTSYAAGYREYSYSQYSSFASNRQSVYSRYFTLILEKDARMDATDFDFSIVVSVDYDTYTTPGYTTPGNTTPGYTSSSSYFRWYWVALPLSGISIFCSILACAIRSYRYRQLARDRAANGNVATVNTSSANNPPAYSTVSQPNTAAPPSYPAQPYPTGNQAYPTQPQPYPNHSHFDSKQAPPTYEEIVTSNPPSK